MLWHFTILKMCVHEEYHLVLIFKDYLVSMWYIILMRNLNSIMSINNLIGFYCLLLLKFKFLGLEIPLVLPRRLQSPSEVLGPMEIDFNNLFENLFYHIMGEYYALCILQIHEMCIFEVVSHSVDIVNYLASMWHVFSYKFQFAKLFYCSCFGSCL
jgi:hypothetical protein